MADPVQPEKVVTKAEHFGAAVMDQTTALNANIRRMQELRRNRGGAVMFEQEVEVPDQNAKQPNFMELNNVKDRMPAGADKLRITNKINTLQLIVNQDPTVPATPAELQMIGTVAADVPAIVVALAQEIGGGVSLANVKNYLRTNDMTVREHLIKFRSDPKFLQLLRDNIGGIEVDVDSLENESKARALREKVARERKEIDATKKAYEASKTWYDGLPPAAKMAVVNNANAYDSSINVLNMPDLGAFKRSSLSRGETLAYTGSVDAYLSGEGLAGPPFNRADIVPLAAAKYPAATPNRVQVIAEFSNKLNRHIDALNAGQALHALYAAHPNLETEYQNIKMYQERPQKLAELKGREDILADQKGELVKLEAQSGKTIANITGKIDTVMDRTFKEYHNKALLKEAHRIAELDAQSKTEEKQKAVDLKEKQEQNAKTLMDKYLRLSYLRFQGNRLKGFDDAGLKDLVKREVYHNSPAEMSRVFLRRIWDKRSDLPDTYQREIEKLAEEMGRTAGPPPVTFEQIINQIDQKKLEDLAAEEMPKALGYARAKGYYFDRLRVTRGQVEYLHTAYGPDFFDKMAAYHKDFETQFEKEFGKGITKGDTRKRIRELLLGRDWGQGMHRLMNVAAAAGGTALIASFFGGLPTVGWLGAAGSEVVKLGSTVGTIALQEPAKFIALEAAKANASLIPAAADATNVAVQAGGTVGTSAAAAVGTTK